MVSTRHKDVACAGSKGREEVACGTPSPYCFEKPATARCGVFTSGRLHEGLNTTARARHNSFGRDSQSALSKGGGKSAYLYQQSKSTWPAAAGRHERFGLEILCRAHLRRRLVFVRCNWACLKNVVTLQVLITVVEKHRHTHPHASV